MRNINEPVVQNHRIPNQAQQHDLNHLTDPHSDPKDKELTHREARCKIPTRKPLKE